MPQNKKFNRLIHMHDRFEQLVDECFHTQGPSSKEVFSVGQGHNWQFLRAKVFYIQIGPNEPAVYSTHVRGIEAHVQCGPWPYTFPLPILPSRYISLFQHMQKTHMQK